MSLALKAARARGGNGGRIVSRSRPMGDPGLFSFIGKAVKSVAGGAIGLVTGGPGAAVSAALSPFTGGGSVAPSIPFAQGPMPGSGNQVIVAPKPGVSGAVQRFLPGGQTGYEVLACPSGFHANKADYFLKDGTYVAKGTRCVRNRSRNPLNPRALRRAVARVDAGKTWQGKLHEIETGRYTKAGNRK